VFFVCVGNKINRFDEILSHIMNRNIITHTNEIVDLREWRVKENLICNDRERPGIQGADKKTAAGCQSKSLTSINR